MGNYNRKYFCKGGKVMATNWTPEQRQAIVYRDCNLLVAAAAGAGKTAVLVQRIINRILDEENPVDIDRLLVVTFTNAAAAEMRERIGDAISKEIEKNPDSKRLQRQIALLSKSYITTIHSFCLEVIRNNFHMIDLDPGFRIADATETILLRQEAMDEIFDENYEIEENEDFIDLVEMYGGGRGDSNLLDMVLKLYEFSMSTPWPKEWIEDVVHMFNVDDDFDFSSSIWAKVLTDNIKIELSGYISMYENAIEMIEGLGDFEKYYDHLIIEIDKLKSIERLCDDYSWDSLYEGFSSISFDRLPNCKKGADKDTQKAVKDIRDSVKKGINDIKSEILVSNSEEIKREMKSLYPSMKSLARLVLDFGDRYREKKKEKNIIDFNDIEHFCIDILIDKESGKPSIAALDYRDRFEEILIDEYQDSNMVQELILSTISRKDSKRPNIFMVGDVKQSIYRFRQAKPELFLQKYNTYKMDDCSKDRKVLLYKNFRSRKEVLDGVNYIFRSIMSKNIGELEYDENEELNLGAAYPEADKSKICGGPVEVHIIETKKDEDAEDDEDIGSIQLEARMVGKRINELIRSDFVVFDKNKGEYRPIEYRDIVILMRATSMPGPIFMEELTNSGVPVFADTGSGYFDCLEVQIVLSLLQIIDNPRQDIPLISVLRSSIVGMTEEDLIEIRIADNKKTFYDALNIKASIDDEVGRKAKNFLNDLNRWRDMSKNKSISEFLWYLYTDTGFFAYVGAMPGGVQRQANLKILFERARQYEETSFKGLFNFINFINKLKKNSGDMGSAKILGENENVVRIMSIHKSKGLEFPVVFVSTTGRKFNLMDLNSDILFHHELGLGPDYVDPKRRISYPTVIKQAIKRKMKLESYSEEMRVLYVAFTRAKEKIIITGTVSDADKALSKWADSLNYPGHKIPEHEIINGDRYLDWIGPCLMKHIGCNSIRESAMADNKNLIDDDSKWNVFIEKRQDIIIDDSEATEEIAENIDDTEEDKNYTDEIKRRLEFKYPYKEASRLPAKLTVTELKRVVNTIDDELSTNIFVPPLTKKPKFMEEGERLSAVRRGTIMHLVMQKIDIQNTPSIIGLEQLIKRLVEDEYITEKEVSGIDKNRILGFFESPIGKRMCSSSNVKRERPFYMEIKSSETYPNLDEDIYKDETIILQGIIDCYFEEPDGLVLIDYKTDYVPNGRSEDLREKYRVQLDYYAKALERITGKRVKERYIYLFYNGDILKY